MSKFVTAKEARKILGISSATLMRWRDSGKIPSMQVSPKKILYDVDNISNPEEADGELQFARSMAASSGKVYDGVYEWLKPIADVTPCRNVSYIAADGAEQTHRISNPQYENGKLDAVETRQWNPGNARQEIVYAIINKVYKQCANSASHKYEIPVVGMAKDGSISADIPEFEVQLSDLQRLQSHIQERARQRMPGYSYVQLIRGGDSTEVKAMLMSVSGVGDNPADFKDVKTD